MSLHESALLCCDSQPLSRAVQCRRQERPQYNSLTAVTAALSVASLLSGWGFDVTLMNQHVTATPSGGFFEHLPIFFPLGLSSKLKGITTFPPNATKEQKKEKEVFRYFLNFRCIAI